MKIGEALQKSKENNGQCIRRSTGQWLSYCPGWEYILCYEEIVADDWEMFGPVPTEAPEPKKNPKVDR
jgi:hypothetical protein